MSYKFNPFTGTLDIAGATGATTLDGLSDVTITSVAKGHILWYDGTDWKNFARPTIGSGYYLTNTATGVLAWTAIPAPISETWGTVLANGRTTDGSGLNNPQTTGTDRIEFRDANKYIYSSASTVLDIVGDGIINLTPTTSTNTAKPIVSTLSTGTAPFTIASTTKVTNLNVDKTDGFDLDQDVTSGGSPTFVRATLSQTTGTAPLTVSSTTKVTNLNADKTDGFDLDQDVTTGGSPSFVKATFTQATGTAPMTVSSTTKVTNLNSDLLDGKDTGTSGNTIPLLDGTNTWSGKQTMATPSSSIASQTFPAGSAPSSPVEGDVWNDSTQKTMTRYIDSIKQNMVGVFWANSAQLVITSTNETSMITTGVGTVTLPANFWVAGKVVRITLRARTTDQAGAGASSIRLKIGGSTLLTQACTAYLAATANLGVEGTWDIICYTTGATGTVMADGFWHKQTGNNASTTCNTPASATTTVDTTGTLAIDLTWDWVNASNSFTVDSLTMEALN